MKTLLKTVIWIAFCFFLDEASGQDYLSAINKKRSASGLYVVSLDSTYQSKGDYWAEQVLDCYTWEYCDFDGMISGIPDDWYDELVVYAGDPYEILDLVVADTALIMDKETRYIGLSKKCNEDYCLLIVTTLN